MSRVLTLPRGSEVFATIEPFDFELTYELAGPRSGPVVVVQGGISAGRHVASTAADPRRGWWEPLVGCAKAIDRATYRVLGIDWLTAARRCNTIDQARATKRLLDHLEIDRVHAFVGASYGGMVGLAFAEQFPEALRHLVAVSAPHESHPFSTGQRSLQRRVLQLGIDHGLEREALEIARGLGMLSYRSQAEFARRFACAPDGGDGAFPVERYLEARGRDFARCYDAETIRRLSLAIDRHRVQPERIPVPVTLVAATSDTLVPPDQIHELAARLAGPVRLEWIESLYGHDAFLKEVAALEPILRRALQEVPR